MAKDNNDAKSLFESSEDAKDLFESAEDSLPAQNLEKVSTLEGLMSGLKTGATLGFRDEIAGIAGALGGKYGGDVRPFSEIYEEAKQLELADEASIKAQAPKATTVGEITGSILPSLLLTPAAGASQATTLGGKALQTGTQLAKGGAVVGAIQGAGQSEADSMLGLAGDTLSSGLVGAGTGLLVGAAAPVAGAAVSKVADKGSSAVKGLANLLRKTELGDDIVYAAQKGLKGEAVFGPEAIKAAEEAVVQARKAAETQIRQSLKASGQAKGKLLKEATDKLVDLDPVYNEALEKLRVLKAPTTPEKAAKAALEKELVELRSAAKAGDLLEAEAQKESLQALSKVGQPGDMFPKSPATSRLAKETSRAVREAVEAPFEGADKLNPLRDINAKYKAGIEAEELIPTLPEIQKSSKALEPAVKEKLSQFSELFKKSLTPELEEQLAKSGTKLAPEQIKEAGYQFLKTKNIQGPREPGLGGLVSTAISTVPKAANIAGQGIAAAQKGAGKVVEQVSKLNNAPRAALLERAAQLEASGSNVAAETLKQVASKDIISKNAALFSISQNPEIKNKIFGNKEESEK